MQTIVEREWQMFHQIESSNNAQCVNNKREFMTIRWALFGVWDDKTLEAYLYDLICAANERRNIVAEKYARMERAFKPSKDPIITEIVHIEKEWHRQIKEKYPYVHAKMCRQERSRKDGYDFECYLQSELETYSRVTLQSYRDNVLKNHQLGENLAEKSLSMLARSSGHESIQQLEMSLKNDAR
jgi:hypothetical protein